MADGEAKPVKRRANGTFERGSTGNAGGRPCSVREVRELAQCMSAAALERLFEIGMSPKTPPLAAVAALREVLDRANGRPAQVTVSADVGTIDSADIGNTDGLTALLLRAQLHKAGKLSS
jgi:hypothetical protein